MDRNLSIFNFKEGRDMMKQIKLLINGLCAVLPVIVIWVYTWINPLGYMDQEAPYYIWNKKKTTTKQEKTYKNIILGDSTANAAYVPELLSDDTINLALGGTTPVENYYMLREWLDHHKTPDTCYISFADVHFRWEDCFWKRTMYSHRFPLRVNLEILKAAVQYEEESIVSGGYITDFISYQFYLPNKYITSLLNAGFNQRYENNIAAQQSNDLHGGRYIALGTGEYVPENAIVQNEFYVTPFFDEYYRKIMQLCKDHNIQVRIVKLPLPDNKVFTEDYNTAFDEYYKNLKKTYPEVTIDRFVSYRSDYFADENHMNSHGALLFSNEIKKIYPSDFDNTNLSFEQVAGINDSIAAENKIEQIMKWIAGKDYTIVLNDGTGKFKDIYDEQLKMDHLELYQMNVWQFASEPAIDYITGLNCKNAGFAIHDTEDGLKIKLKSQESQLWEMPDGDTLKVVVIDNYNHRIVCLKSFKYAKETFH